MAQGCERSDHLGKEKDVHFLGIPHAAKRQVSHKRGFLWAFFFFTFSMRGEELGWSDIIITTTAIRRRQRAIMRMIISDMKNEIDKDARYWGSVATFFFSCILLHRC